MINVKSFIDFTRMHTANPKPRNPANAIYKQIYFQCVILHIKLGIVFRKPTPLNKYILQYNQVSYNI